MSTGLRPPWGLPSSGRPAAWLRRPELVLIAVLLLAGALLRPVAGSWSEPIAVAPQYGRSAMTLWEVLPEPGYLVPVSRRTPEEEISPENAVRQLLAGPVAGPDLEAPFSHGTELLAFELDEKHARVALSPVALETDDLQRAIDALVLTLTEFPEVTVVSVAADQTHADDLERPTINPESETASEDGTLLYFAYQGEDRYLVPVTRESPSYGPGPAAVMDEFLAGPQTDSGLEPVVPSDVRVREVRLEDGLATVDFNANLVYAYRLSKANSLFVRRAVMATLTDLPEVDAGLIEIDGSRLLLYTCVNVTQEFPQARPWAINDEFYLETLPLPDATAA